MADSAAQETAAKLRIITHMNQDHHDSIIRYLEHYHHLSSWTAYDGKLTDVSLEGMTFTCPANNNGKTYYTPFQPVMQSYRDARERAVAMDRESLAGLRRSDITVHNFLPPTGWYAVGFAILATVGLVCSQRWCFESHGPVEQIFGRRIATLGWQILPWIFWSLFGIHVVEAALFAAGRLRKHSVNPRTRIWWLWLAVALVEGRFAIKRFDDFVELKRQEKAKQKH